MSKHCCNNSLSEAEARSILEMNGLNKTKVKIKILTELSGSSKPLSVAEMHELFKDQACNISTIFRSVTQFKEKNILKEVSLGEGFFRYELNDPKEKHHHHHHVRCRKCGEIRPLENCDLSKFDKMLRELGYQEIEHRLEFTGLCSSCR